jgi:hypothetical protein
MTEKKQKKQFFAKHAKSSAVMVSLAIHGILVLIAVSFVAVTVITKEEKKFEAKPVNRPKQKLKKLQVPVKVKKQKPKPKLRKRVVVKNVTRKTPEFKMPEITGVKGGLGSAGDGAGGMESIGFTMPELDFFGAKAKGEKVVFVVHFGPATIGNNPFSRMTGYTIRKRLEDLVNGMPEYTLFNVTAYYAGDNWPISPTMMLATPDNKQKVMDWMEPVNPLEGEYDHCFQGAPKSIKSAYANYPTKVENLPFYSTKWAYPYAVPQGTANKYLPEGKNYKHWNRGVAWAILTQQPDTIFVLTTNYIDPWGAGNSGEPAKIAASYKKMFVDVYGPDKKRWPTINIVVLAKAGKDSQGAYNILNSQFGPIWKGSKGSGSVIEDITKYMNADERNLMDKYRAEYGNSQKNR